MSHVDTLKIAYFPSCIWTAPPFTPDQMMCTQTGEGERDLKKKDFKVCVGV